MYPQDLAILGFVCWETVVILVPWAGNHEQIWQIWAVSAGKVWSELEKHRQNNTLCQVEPTIVVVCKVEATMNNLCCVLPAVDHDYLNRTSFV
jgi:hypothetical protein